MNKVLHMVRSGANRLTGCAWKLGKRAVAFVVQTACGVAAAVARFFVSLAGKVARWAGNKLAPLLPPLFLVTMIVSAVLAAASCAGWLLTRKKVA